MTESEWLACHDPEKMLQCLRGKASDRKLRLFACACCHRISRLLTDDRSRKAVEVALLFSDGNATAEELAAARKAAAAATEAASASPSTTGSAAAWAAAAAAADAARSSTVAIEAAIGAARNAGWASAYAAWAVPWDTAIATVRQEETLFLRDIFIPFRPAILAPAWLTPNVISLAQHIYTERRFDDMSLLADALEQAGCDDTDILNHCRQPGEHVRGCWVVDLILAKR